MKKQKKSSIKLVLSGGLGNQLFQYAACRSLAIQTRSNLIIDLRFYDKCYGSSRSEYRPCLIDQLPVTADFIYNQGDHRFVSRIRRHVERLQKRVYWSNNLGFDAAFTSLNPPLVVSSLLQSHKYFESNWMDIKPELNCDLWIDDTGKPVQSKIASGETVAVHVRRGDYLVHPELNIGDLNAYYRRAIVRMATLIKDPHFAFFSDDISWCKNNFSEVADNIQFIEFRDGRSKPEREFALMTKCQHHIIANSTYSWWAAYLASHDNQCVIMPRKWTKGLKSQDIDLKPEHWEVIDCE